MIYAYAVFLTYILMMVAAVAHGHEWYSAACCSDRDCGPIPDGTKVTGARNGYSVVLPDGETTFFSHDKVKPSQDGLIHVCIGISNRTPYCLYMPAGA